MAAQEFKIADVTALTGLAVDQLKPKTIVFIDQPADETIDPDAGLIRFEDWAQTKPVQKQFLSPYPSYVEPMVEVTVDGVRKRFKEKLHMYVAAARYSLARAPDALDLASLVNLPFIERIDPAIKHRLITSAEAVSPKDPRAVHNQHPLRRWCEARPLAICIHSSYKFEGKLPLGIQIANKIRESSKRIAETLEFESELTLRSPAEVTEMGLASLTGLDTPPVGALEQTIFYVNQVMQFGKLLAVFQQHPTDPKQTVVTRLHGAWRWNRTCSARRRNTARCRCCVIWCRRRCWPARARSTPAIRSAPGCRSTPATRSRRSPRSSRRSRVDRRDWRPRRRQSAPEALGCENPRFFGPLRLDFAVPRRYIPPTFGRR